MSDLLSKHSIYNFQTYGGVRFDKLDISFQLFGQKLNTAPIVVVNHALTGNSDVASEERGWWKTIIGKNKLINTEKYTVIAFNVPGNGYDGVLFEDYKVFTTYDIAKLFSITLKSLNIKEVYATIGGSLGGALAWEMAVLEPNLIKYVIPIACNWKSTDWVIGQCYVQDSILNNSKTPLEEARMMAMLFYRTSASFTAKFHRSRTDDDSKFNVESWLQHHGDKLTKRFELNAYKIMNHLLTTIDIVKDKLSFKEAIKDVKSTIIQVGIDSDLFFVAEENRNTQKELDSIKHPNQYHEIKSIHGHDAFLIEFEQLIKILKPVF